MSTYQEIESFISKFKYLCSAGYSSTLSLSSEKGQVSVSFNVNLGFLPPPTGVPPPSSVLSPRRRSPSYIRRLKRRKDAREAPECNLNEKQDTVEVSEDTNYLEDTNKDVNNTVEAVSHSVSLTCGSADVVETSHSDQEEEDPEEIARDRVVEKLLEKIKLV